MAERLIVDGMNVLGSRPDGWWRDRAAAMERMTRRLAAQVSPLDVATPLPSSGFSFSAEMAVA